MLQRTVDITKMPLDPSDTIRGYLSRVADWYQVPLGNLGNLLEKASFGTGLSKAEEQEFQTILDSLREAAARKGPPGLSEEAEIGQAETPLVQDETPVAESREHQPHSGEEARRHQVQEVYHQPATGMPSLPDLTVGFSRVWGTLASAPSRLAKWPYQVTTWPARIRTQGRSILAWRPTAGQLVTLASLLFLYGVSLALHLPDRPTSFWHQDSSWTFAELLRRLPTGWDSFSSTTTTPLGLLRHPHGVIQYIPGLVLISFVELFKLPFTDYLLDTFYVAVGSAIVVPIYMITRVTSGSRLVGTLATLFFLFMPRVLFWMRSGGETHASFALGSLMLVLWAFYRYGKNPSPKRAWVVGLALGIQWATDNSFFLTLPAALFALLSAKEGPFWRRCLATTRNIVQPRIWIIPSLVLTLHIWSYVVTAPTQGSGMLGHIFSKGEQFPLAFRPEYLWNLLSVDVPSVLPFVVLTASVPGLWYTARLHPSGILFVWGWTYLLTIMLKFPRDIHAGWNVFGTLPLIILALVLTWVISNNTLSHFRLSPRLAAIPVSLVFLVLTIPLMADTGHAMNRFSYGTQEAGTKAGAAYVRNLPDEGGNVVAWGIHPHTMLFYFTRTTAMPALNPTPLDEIRTCMERLEQVTDTFIIYGTALKRFYLDAEANDFFEPSPPFQLVTTIEDKSGTAFASIYRRTDDGVGTAVKDLSEGNRTFDNQYSRVGDLSQGPWGMAYVRRGEYCSSFPTPPLKVTPLSDCVFGSTQENRSARGQPLPFGDKSNIHPNSSTEDGIDFHGKGVKAVLDSSRDWAVDGSHSVKVTITETTDSHRGSMTSPADAISATPSTEYEASVMAKSSSCGWLTLAARQFDKAGNTVAYNTSPSTVVSGQPTWLGLTFTSTPLTYSFSFEVRAAISAPMEEGFIYYYDNLQIWEKGQATP